MAMASVIKNPPVLGDIENYEKRENDIMMRREIADLGKNKQALANLLTLKGQGLAIVNLVSTVITRIIGRKFL